MKLHYYFFALVFAFLAVFGIANATPVSWDGNYANQTLVPLTSLLNAKVGLGSTTPYAQLSVKGAGTTTGVNFQTTNSSDSPLFTILDSGNVGIGSTSPTQALSVNGKYVQTGAAGTAGDINAGSAGVYSWNGASRYVRFNTNGTINDLQSIGAALVINFGDAQNVIIGGSQTSAPNKLNVMGSLGVGASYGAIAAPTNGLIVEGNVGIGSNNPQTKLEVVVGSGATSGIRQTLSSGVTTEGTDWYYDNTGNTTTYLQSRYDNAGASIQFRLRAAGTPVTAMTILGSGNVGIGTTTPQSNLSVVSTGSTIAQFDTSSAAGGYLTFSRNGTTGGYIGIGNSLTSGGGLTDLSLRSQGGSILFSNSGGTETARITNAGLVGVASSTPWGLLSVNPNGIGTGVPEFVVGSSTATHFIVAGGGKVGVGTKAPAFPLEVYASSGDTVIAASDSTGSGKAYFRAAANSGGVRQTFGTDSVGGFMFMETAHPFYITSGQDFYVNVPTRGEAFRIKTITGNVGIGSTTPFSTLSVTGTAGTRPFTIASSTQANLFSVSSSGELRTGGATPVISACGAIPDGAVVGNDTAGTVTVGGGVPTSCTVTYNTPKVGTTHVFVQVEGATAIGSTISAKSSTGFTATFGAALGGGTFSYWVVTD